METPLPIKQNNAARASSLWELDLFNIKGIPIRAHFSLALMLIWLGLDETVRLNNHTSNIGLVIFIFAAILITQLAELLVSKILKIDVKEFTLYPFGGIVSHLKEPQARKQIIASLSGPITSFAISLLLFPFVTSFNLENLITSKIFIDRLFLTNILLSAINFLPSPPFAAHRALRAYASTQTAKQNEFAVKIVQISCGILCFASFWSGSLLLIALAGFSLAQTLEQHVQLKTKAALAKFSIPDVMVEKELLVCFTHGTTLSTALKLITKVPQPWYPVIFNNSILGLVEREKLLRQIALEGSETYVNDYIVKEFLSIESSEDLQKLFSTLVGSSAQVPIVVLSNGDFAGLIFKERVLEFALLNNMKNTSEKFSQENDIF